MALKGIKGSTPWLESLVKAKFAGSRAHVERRIDPTRLAIRDEIQKINLKPVKQINFQFDPFHESTQSIRAFLFGLNERETLKTNLNCVIRTKIVCNREEPTINVTLENEQKILFKTAFLSTLEIFQHFNNIVLPFAPPPEDILTKIKKKK